MPSSKKAPTRPPTVSAVAMRSHAKRNDVNVPEVIARLADELGIRPSDVPDFAMALPLMREARIDPKNITPRQLAEAGGLWRAGINDVLRRVEEHNQRVVVAESKPEPKPIVKSFARKNSVEILGMPLSTFLRGMAAAGFSMSAARAALDELGGLGVKNATLRQYFHVKDEDEIEPLSESVLDELEQFRDAKADVAVTRPAVVLAPVNEPKVTAMT